MQQFDRENVKCSADDENRTSCACNRLLLISLFVAIFLDIVAIVYYTTVPAEKNDVLILLGELKLFIHFCCISSVNFLVCHTSFLQAFTSFMSVRCNFVRDTSLTAL